MDLIATVDGVALLVLVVIAAALYSAVGYGGASGYLAAMALFGLDPTVMRPAALVMNVFVSGLVLYRLRGTGFFNGRLFWPFALASIPTAFAGGALVVPNAFYSYLVGLVLMVPAAYLLIGTRERAPRGQPALWASLPTGAGLGFLSGLTGVGGGIFLSPLLLFMGWASMRATAAIAAGFILVNSLAALAGYAAAGTQWPTGIPALVIAALLGALVGSELLVRRLRPEKLRRLLGVVLVLAAAKLMLTA